MFTPLVGVPMENSLDLVIVWAMYGTYMRKTFWPIPSTPHHPATATSEPHSIKWPKKAHPGALSETGRERTPWLSPAGRVPLSNKGVCPCYHTWKVYAKPSCQENSCFRPVAPLRIVCGRLYSMLSLGWETLPIALLGMPHYPALWVVDTWKPIGGCCYTGSPVALVGNSAFRFCLLMQWHTVAIDPQQNFLGDSELSDPEIAPVESPQKQMKNSLYDNSCKRPQIRTPKSPGHKWRIIPISRCPTRS